MAAPRVFISSTCYDLRYIRENLRFFISNMGFEPVLSETGSVFFDPVLHVQDACLAEVPNCQMCVLIIGGRFGSNYKKEAESVVNYEYREAIKHHIPVFALVDQQVLAEYYVYLKNIAANGIDVSKISYPNVDSTKIFSFIREVESSAFNNALVPFANYNEIESYLKHQWASMVFNFLSKRAESERVASMLETLTTMSNRIEFLSKQILSSVGSNIEKVNAILFDIMSMDTSIVPLYSLSGRQTSPINVIESLDLYSFLERLGFNYGDYKDSQIVTIEKSDAKLELPKIEFLEMKEAYLKLRQELVDELKRQGLKTGDFIKAIYNKKES